MMTQQQEKQLDISIQSNSRMMKRFEEIQRSEEYELAPGVEAIKWFIPSAQSSQFIEKNAFNQWMREMLEYGLKTGENRVLSISCPANKRCVQYLDIDHFVKCGGYIDFSEFVRNRIISTITKAFKELSIQTSSFYILTFYPKDISRRCENHDCAAHVYIVFNIEEVEKVESLIETLGQRLKKLLKSSFDANPWKSSTLNLPFSHKAFDSTEYKLKIDDCFPADESALIDAFHNVPFITHSQVLEDTDECVDMVSKVEGKFDIDNDAFELLKNSFDNFENMIHNYQEKGSSIKDECCLLPLFGAINSIKNVIYRNGIIEAIRLSGKLTENASKHINEHLADEPTNPSILIDIIEIHAPQYFKTYFNKFQSLKKKMKEQNIQNLVSSKDYQHELIKRTTIETIKSKQTESEMLDEILGSVRFLCNHSSFLEYIDRSRPNVIKQKQLIEKLETIFTDSKHISEIVKIIKTKAYIVDEEISFNLLFNNWAHDVEGVNENDEIYKRHVEGFIEALSNVFTTSESKDYFLHWVNYILHHPGKQTGVFILIQGRQGTGKTYIAQTIAELFRGYEIANGSMNDLTDRFNIQHLGKNIYIINEIKDANQTEKHIYDTMKTKTTDSPIPYEEKGITKFMGQNSLNIIGISNNARPILADIDDRRIFNVKSSSANANDKSYWSKYFKLREEKNFYENICHYIKSLFKKDDDFLSLEIPETREKLELIKSGLSNLNKFIYDNFNVCCAGINRKEFKELHAKGDFEQKESNMWNEYIKRCSMYKSHNVIYYQLKDEELQDFNKIMFDTIEQISNQDENENDVNDENNNWDEWIKANKNTNEKKFDYILISVINNQNTEEKKQLIDALLAKGWKYDRHLGPKRSLYGYKKMNDSVDDSKSE